MTDANKRFWTFIGLLVYGVVGYGLVNHFNMHRSHYFDVSFPFEKNLPFIPFFSIGYLLVYIANFTVYFLTPYWNDFRHKVAKPFFWLATIHYIFFLLIPVTMPRPDISGLTDGFFLWLTRFFYSIDHPVNCFPSLHVAYPTLAALVTWKDHPKWRPFFVGIAILTAISVVLIKQHYILDVVAGAGVAGLVFWGFKAPYSDQGSAQKI